MGEGLVNNKRNGIGSGTVPPVCVLVRVDIGVYTILDMGHDQSLKALHDYWSEGHWPLVIQA